MPEQQQQQQQQTDWKENLPESMRDLPFIAKAGSIDEAVEKIQHAAHLVGTSVRIPDTNTSPENRKKFYDKLAAVDGVTVLPTHDDIDGVVGLLRKLGYPDSPDKYELPELDGFEWDGNMAGDLRKFAHEAGLTPGQLQAFAARIAAQERDADTRDKQEHQTRYSELKETWGDAYEENKALVRGYLKQSDAPAETREALDNETMPASALKWLHDVARQFKSSTTPVHEDGRTMNTGETKLFLREKAQKIRLDMANMRETDPRYPELRRELITVHKELAAG